VHNHEIAAQLVRLAKAVAGRMPDTKGKRRILTRAAEHEMNVDSGDEIPCRGFSRLVRLLKKAGRDGEALNDSEWLWLWKT